MNLKGFVFWYLDLMNFKRILPTALAITAIFGSSLIMESLTNIAVSEEVKSPAAKEAEKRVPSAFNEFKRIINGGAEKNDLVKFFHEQFDVDAIVGRFCGKKDSESEKAFKKFEKSLEDLLVWRLKTEALQTVKKCKIDGNNVRATDKGTTYISASLNLTRGEDTDPIDMEVIFSKKGGKLGKIIDLVILKIQLIESACNIINSYFEEHGIKTRSLTAKERAEKSAEALDDFVKRNAREKSKTKN